MEKRKSQWKLVEVASLPAVAGVVEACEKWEKKQVWVQLPSGQWRRGVVLVVGNDGAIMVGVYQNGQVVFAVAIRVDRASRKLRMASH